MFGKLAQWFERLKADRDEAAAVLSGANRAGAHDHGDGHDHFDGVEHTHGHTHGDHDHAHPHGGDEI